jgi:hypothetical protein
MLEKRKLSLIYFNYQVKYPQRHTHLFCIRADFYKGVINSDDARTRDPRFHPNTAVSSYLPTPNSTLKTYRVSTNSPCVSNSMLEWEKPFFGNTRREHYKWPSCSQSLPRTRGRRTKRKCWDCMLGKSTPETCTCLLTSCLLALDSQDSNSAAIKCQAL